jgi:hypothetical protein
VEPLRPDLRAALKEAHPGLTDDDIDRAEELVSLRMTCDPENEAARIADLDRQLSELISEKMPRYNEVSRLVKLREQAAAGRASPRVRIRERTQGTEEPA